MEIRNHHFLPFNVAIQDWPYQSGRSSSFAVFFLRFETKRFFLLLLLRWWSTIFSRDYMTKRIVLTSRKSSSLARSLRCKKCWKSRWNNNETISLEMIERLQSMGKICAQKTKEKYFRGENEMRNRNKCYILGSTFSRKIAFSRNF